MTKEELIKLTRNNISNNIRDSAFDVLEKVMNITLKENEKFNLTAIKDEDKFRELMIYDSLYPLKYFDYSNKKIIDVGTGAGFPGLPLAISSSGFYTLLDSTAKKINHIKTLCGDLGIYNVKTVTARAEEYAREVREEYDYAIARAVSSLKILAELVLPLLKVGGCFIAMKGAKAEEEIQEAEAMLKTLGGEIVKVDEYELPLSREKRVNIIIKKTKETPKKFPREYSQIIKA